MDDDPHLFGPPEPFTRSAFPWPPAEDQSVLGGFGETWKSATFDPGAFFSRLPRNGGTGSALLYCLVIGVLVAGAGLFWDAGMGWTEVLREDGAETARRIQPLVAFLLTPLILLIALVLSAAVSHVLLLLTGGAHHGFGTTLRVFAYSYSPMIFGVIPLLGSVVGGIWMTVLGIIGLREAHETRGWKAAFAVLLPLFLVLSLMVVLTLMILATGAGMLLS